MWSDSVIGTSIASDSCCSFVLRTFTNPLYTSFDILNACRLWLYYAISYHPFSFPPFHTSLLGSGNHCFTLFFEIDFFTSTCKWEHVFVFYVPGLPPYSVLFAVNDRIICSLIYNQILCWFHFLAVVKNSMGSVGLQGSSIYWLVIFHMYPVLGLLFWFWFFYYSLCTDFYNMTAFLILRLFFKILTNVTCQ